MKNHPRQATFDKRKARPIYHAINKYGWDNVIKEELHTDLSTQEAYDIEAYLIRFYEATDFNIGYNLALGGRTLIGCKMSTNANKGRKYNEERRAALRKGKEGKSYSMVSSNNAQKYSIKATLLDTGEVLLFKGVTEFSKYANIPIFTVYNHIYRESKILNLKWNVRYHETLTKNKK